MKSDTASTQFAPAERLPKQEVERQASTVEQLLKAGVLLNAIPEVALILNQERQIVFCNTSLLEVLKIPDPVLLYGRRPGKALHCIHAGETDEGCGTTKYCSTCGAVLAILTSQQEGRKDVRECRITMKKDDIEEAVEFRVWTNPITIEDERFTIFSVANISDEKRRHVLERIFFHDLRNTAGSLLHLAQVSRERAKDDENTVFAKNLDILARQIVSEIQTGF